MKRYFLAIDQGTTGSTALLADAESLEIITKVNQEFPQIYPQPGWVEHDLNDIWKSVESSIQQCIEKAQISVDQIIGIGITNQRETTCAFSKKGEPLHNAIVWQDRRTAIKCEELKENYKSLQLKTGLPLDPYFSATKMNWLLTNSEKVKKAAKEDNLLFSNIDAYLLYKLSNAKSFKTDATNASRTLLLNLETQQWDSELLNFFEISKNFLPNISSNFENFGETKNLTFLPDGIPILCMMGDQQAALFGQACFFESESKCTYGTGAFMLQNTGSQIIHSTSGLLTTIAFKDNEKVCYALEGSSFIAGAAVQWLRDNLGFFEESPQIEELAKKAELKNMEDVMLLPFFTGIGTPYWKPEAKAALVGLTRGIGKSEISRACLEGIALSVHDLIKTLESDSSKKIETLNVDGGACSNNELMQYQANFSSCTINRPQIIETTAYGVILGCHKTMNKTSFKDLKSLRHVEKEISNENDLSYFQQKNKKWDQYIKKNFLS